MNSSIFWKLYLGRKIRQKDLPDAQYEKILKTVCQNVSADDWTRFMHAARFAAFAKNELAKEEAEFCWQIYSTLYPKVTAHKRFTT